MLRSQVSVAAQEDSFSDAKFCSKLTKSLKKSGNTANERGNCKISKESDLVNKSFCSYLEQFRNKFASFFHLRFTRGKREIE